MDNESWSFGQIWRLFGNYRVGPEKVARVLSMAQIQKLIQEPNAERIYHHRSCWKRLRPAPIHSCASLIILRYTRCNTVIYTVYESNPQTIQELKDNISHAVAAIKITMLHRVYLNMVTARLLITVQTLYAIYILTPDRIAQRNVKNGRRANFSWPTLLYNSLVLSGHRLL